MKKFLFLLYIALVFGAIEPGQCSPPPVSEATSECLECHQSKHPGIVSEWRNSRHGATTPKQAMTLKQPRLKVSSPTVPKTLLDTVVGCAECHTQRPDAHADTFEHNGYPVHTVVSPRDCATCHIQEATQFSKNKMAHARKNLLDNTVYQALAASINGTLQFKKEKISVLPPDPDTEAESCLYCHGTHLSVNGNETRDTDFGEMSFPKIDGWPNQGVGRKNLDGSLGACSACHTRHQFSMEMARKPYTCKECHVGPDVPAFKIYSTSKHGNIFSAMNPYWNFKSVPWTIGKDFTAPTCAACHISLLADTDDEIVVQRTHQMSDRLPWRIFGLIYAHPHPKEADTTAIRNKAGLPLPTDFNGRFASAFLIDATEREKRRDTLQSVCLGCHDQSWVQGHWNRFNTTIRQTNEATRTATDIMENIWKRQLADGFSRGSNPFNEAIERKWTNVWLFHANTIRFASAMGGGGDYGVFAGGRYQLWEEIVEMEDWFTLRKRPEKK